MAGRCQIRQMIQDIIENYKKFITQKNWTYAIAAEAIGCCRTHLGRIFNGKRVPSMTLLNKMEQVMKNYNFKE